MAKVYVGIDIGKKGGLVAVQDRRIVGQWVMPLVSGEDVDVMNVLRLLQCLDVGQDFHVVMEKFGGFFGYGKNAVASLARQSGYLEGCFISNNIPHTRITPQSWQKMMFEGTKDIRKKEGGRDTKKMALLTANRLFPSESFKPSTKYKNAHDGLVDAALIALFGARKGF